MNHPLPKRLVAEAVGTVMPLAAVGGSGIMGEFGRERHRILAAATGEISRFLDGSARRTCASESTNGHGVALNFGSRSADSAHEFLCHICKQALWRPR